MPRGGPMIIIENDEALERILHSPLDGSLKALLRLRREQYGKDTPLEQLGRIIIVQAGDKLADVARVTGWSIDTAEWVIDHGTVFETVQIESDDGFGIVLLIDKAGIDPALAAILANACD